MIRTTSVALALTIAILLPGSPRAGAADLLANGGFEEGAGGWSLNAGQLTAVAAPVHAGVLSGQFTGSGQPTTQYAYQLVAIQPDEHYEVSGWVAGTGLALTRVFLRVSWFDSGGQLVSQSDSAWLPQFDGVFYRLSTGALLSPSATRSARVSAVVQSDSAFNVHLDDLGLAGPAPPVSTSTPTPHLTPEPTITPGVPPPTAAPTPSPKPRPAASRTPAPPLVTPHASPVGDPVEPLVFPSLVNGSFEELRGDGMPYGWRKQGGEITSASEPRTDGSRSLALQSQTSSTKWAYQTVSVAAGAYYQASVDAYAGDGTEAAFLRVSWYATTEGSGPALSSVDSLDSATPADGVFRRLATAAVQAPPSAASAKIRFMLRPLSDQPAVAYFDAASFSSAEPGTQEVVLGSARGESGNVGGSAPGSVAEAPEVSPDRTENSHTPRERQAGANARLGHCIGSRRRPGGLGYRPGHRRRGGRDRPCRWLRVMATADGSPWQRHATRRLARTPVRGRLPRRSVLQLV